MPTSTATGFKFFSFLRTKALKAFSDLQCEKAENDGLKIAVIHNYASVSKGKCPEVLRNIGNHLLAYHYKDGKAYWNCQTIKKLLCNSMNYGSRGICDKTETDMAAL